MPRAFAKISFTPSVKAAQSYYHSREANLGFELADEARRDLSEHETTFIEARDSFYQATVNQDGWPYVQHRGGPPGFLKVLDQHTIGFADFSGNRQYLSVGNLMANDKISLILMDYRQKRRLKIWGRVKIVHESEAPELIARLEMPSYRARIERGIIIHVEALDWNCPQHITPRFTERELLQLMAPMQAEMAKLQQSQKRSITSLGQGQMQLVVSGIRQLSPQIRAIELRDPQGGDLPEVQAGAHLALPVILKNGQAGLRQYSIASNPARRDVYEIAVLRIDEGSGGSSFVHEHYQLGLLLHCDPPRQHFALRQGGKTALLIAGGIGITAIKPMAQSLREQGLPFALHYAAASNKHMAYGERMRREFGPQLHCYFSDQGQRMDIVALLAQTDLDTDIYVCGPSRMMEQVISLASALGIAAERIHFERFAAEKRATDRSFTVFLQRSQKSLEVAANQSLLQALEIAQIPAASACGTGQCGTCAVKLLAGKADHRDQVLTAQQRQQLFCPCVSRALGDSITLDL